MSETGLQVKVSAPGKVILHGEHSVVYGKLAVAASLNLRTTATLQEYNKQYLEINFTDLKLRQKYDIHEIETILKLPMLREPLPESEQLNPDYIIHDCLIDIITKQLNINQDAFDKFQYQSLVGFFYIYLGLMRLSNAPIVPIQVTIKTELSLGAGTGSSASLMVSLAACFLSYLKCKVPDLKTGGGELTKPETLAAEFNEHDLKLISKWAFAGEQIIHGTPSGIDNTVCTYGSMVSFRKGRAPIAVKCREDIRGLLVDTRVPKDTLTMIKKVKVLKTKHEKIVDCVLSAMETIADDALELFMRLGEVKSGKDVQMCYESLGELADLNHNLLRTLGVSHPALENAVRILTTYNLHGKLTGAGGGGYVVALIPPDVTRSTLDDICNQLSDQGYQCRLTKLGGNGVKIE